MKTPKNAIVTLAMERQRLSLSALASELGVTVEALMVEDLGGRLTVRLSNLVKTSPEPLVAVADLPGEEQTQMREGLLDDVTLLANQRLALEKDLATMRQQYEVSARALNDLRKHMKGIKVVPRFAQYAPGNWKAVRPLEMEYEAAVAANNARARQAKSRKLAEVTAGLSYIQDEQLPEYEIQYQESLSAVHEALDNLAQALQKQATTLAEYRQGREALEAEVPLVFLASGEDLSLRTQQPHEAAAQALAEEAVAAAKAAGRKQALKDQRTEKQERQAREVELVEETFDRLLPRLQAGESPACPSIAPAALNPKLLKGSPAALLARAPRKAKPAEGLVLPKAPRVKRPLHSEEEQVGQKVSTSPVGVSTALASPSIENTLPATAQPQPGQEAGSPLHSSTEVQQAPQAVPPDASPEEDNDCFTDDGQRSKDWLMEVDEPAYQQFYAGPLGGIFPSKAHRDEALADILNARLEEEERQRKEAEWEAMYGDDPPD